nr:MAG TPA: hypothetical protein [Caudoviricetes sp.]
MDFGTPVIIDTCRTVKLLERIISCNNIFILTPTFLC